MSTAPAASSASLDDLTDSQRQSLETYTSVTAQDIAQAIPLLRRSQWNVEIAIAKFFDGETADPVAEALAAQAAAAPPPRPSNTRPNGRSRRNVSLTPAPRIVPQGDAAARRPPLLIQFFLYPFSLLWRFSGGVIALFYAIFPFLPRFRGGGLAGTRPQPRRSQNPRDTAARFIRAFEEEYGSETGLKWFEGGYAQALDLAKSELRFLLVVLQSDEHDDTASFNRETLTNPDVVAFLREQNVLLWGGSVMDSEAYQVSTALDCTKFPFACLITHAPNTPARASSQGMSVVARLAGTVLPETFITKLRNAIHTHSEGLDRVRSERATRAADRAIREQQESAYEISLARDRERARERREAEEQKRREEEEVARKEQEKATLEQKRQQWRKWRASSIAKDEPTSGELARVQIRTRDGGRILRKWEKATSMEEVYAFVECADMVGEDGSLTEKPEGYEHEYGFRLVQMMPRKVFEPREGTVGECLWPSGNLVVEPVEDEDEE